MNVSATDRFTVERAREIYGLDAWGNGYLVVGDDGGLRVAPTRGVVGWRVGTRVTVGVPLRDARVSGVRGRQV